MPDPGSSKQNSVTFRHFWEFIAQQLGDAWLTLNPSANNVSELISLSYDPKDYLKKVIVQSYRRSGCNNLDSPIDLTKLLDVLGETAYSLQGERRDDLFDIELLEEIAWHISDRFAELLRPETTDDAASPTSASVVSFPDYRIRRANARP